MFVHSGSVVTKDNFIPPDISYFPSHSLMPDAFYLSQCTDLTTKSSF